MEVWSQIIRTAVKKVNVNLSMTLMCSMYGCRNSRLSWSRSVHVVNLDTSSRYGPVTVINGVAKQNPQHRVMLGFGTVKYDRIPR
jgi:hypothetical protein